MQPDLEKVFARRVDVGVANMDVSTADGVINTRVVVQHVNGTDGEGNDRDVVLIFEPAGLPELADALRKAAEEATADPTVTPAPRVREARAPDVDSDSP
ncbi:MAG TPA: hypothetical protein VGP70_05415 [Actinomadura sp.]|jgi:phosphodiesterase/alkaline phosphatase D-like protein|nr:hypothetical protein [Actinomadura sp.]